MTTKQWSGRRVSKARAVVVTWLPTPCPHCHHPVTPDQPWVVGHIKSRAAYPELMDVVSNWRAEHRRCSNRTGTAAIIEKAFKAGQNSKSDFPLSHSPGEPPPLSVHTHENRSQPFEVRADLRWTYHAKNAPTWLQPYLEVPEDASPPLAMTPPHPDAVGSYGPQAIEWVKTELGVTLRWWQRLAFVMQLQHDEDGHLLMRTVVESTPRRAGKSIRLRAMALWRIAHSDLFGEKQLAIHTGRDVQIVREIHRQAWSWADAREGWGVRKGAGFEEVNSSGDNRWLVRSQDSVYGYDVCLGMVDEAWGVKAATYEEGLEPATMERLSPQLLLTSTAHRMATSLMRKKITSALAVDDGETLLLLWAAPPGADPADPETWQAASPHWSEDRRKMIAAKYESAMAGEVDPEADDPDPFEAFLAQYLNVWRLNAKAATKGNTVTTEDGWDALLAEVPNRGPDSIAVEAWFAEGVSVALAWRCGAGRGVVRVLDLPDVPEAVAVIKSLGYRKPILVGASLAEEPALTGMRTKPMKGRTSAAAQELIRVLAENGVFHDGSEVLRDQVLAMRTLPGVDGPRLVSRGRADAVKAALWALAEVRAKGMGKPRILLPSHVA